MQFRTGFVALPDDGKEPAGPFRGAGWMAELSANKPGTHPIVGGREVVIESRSWAAAQRAADLINACRQLMNGDPDLVPIQPLVHNDTEPAWMDARERASIPSCLMSQNGLPTSCAIAAKASRRRRWIYAVAKYKFSIQLYSVHHMDMHPDYRMYHGVSRHPDDHVLLAHAILSAFGAIEDLGLGVPAGHGRPSRIDGAWNPDVVADLEARLREAGIDQAETIVWTARGPTRRIERRRPLPTGATPRWAGGPVRDRHVAIADAIGYSDFLRDRVAAHGASPLMRSLSPYDVVNVQHLARCLLLATMGFRVWQRSP
jgi:hypothetical protein